MADPIRIVTRSSPMALAQVERVRAELSALHPGIGTEVLPVTTSGDRWLGDLAALGGKGAFTKEVDAALVAGAADLAVHCLKDVPADRPLPAGTGSREWRRVVEADILPAIDAFAPALIMISAGFDAHRADPLAMLELVEDDYGWVTARLLELARKHSSGRVVSVLEGGYDLSALANSVLAHLNALRGV